MTNKIKINQKEGLQATQFITSKLENSRRYDILNQNTRSVIVKDKKDLAEDQKTIEVVIANALPRVNDVRNKHRLNAKNQIYTVPIFYKDGETAFVRLFDVDSSWIHNKTLKRYTQQQKHAMLKLRNKEELVMQYFGKNLSYYQPETARLPESLREFRMLPVTFDYSHIDKDSNAYRHTVDGAVSKTFKFPQEINRILKDSNVIIEKLDHFWRGHIKELTIPYKENKKGQLFLL